MNVTALGDTTPMSGRLGQLISIDHDHLLIAFCEHPGGHSPAMLAPSTTARFPIFLFIATTSSSKERLRPKVARLPHQMLLGCAQ
jgi:hypothetical protein